MQRMDKLSRVNLPFVFIVFSLTMTTNQLNILSYNVGGFNGCDRTLTKYMLDEHKPHILLLQETWLLKRDLNTLPAIHSNYLSHGKSSVPDNDILQGRSYGGLGILWHKTLAHQVKPIHIQCDRIAGVL